MFIADLFTAGRVYFESRNVAGFDIVSFIKFTRLTLDRGLLSPSDAADVAGVLGIDVRDVLGYMSLGWHLGILAISRSNAYTPTRLAKSISESCMSINEECLGLLRGVFLRWAPLQVLLRYLSVNGFNRGRIVEELGGEMRRWSEILMRLKLPVKAHGGKPPSKPFNDYLVSKLFSRLINQLELSSVRGLGEQPIVAVKSRGGEPLAAVGVAHIAYSSRESTLISPYLDEYGLGFVINVLKAGGGHADIIVKRLSGRLSKLSLNDIRRIIRDEGVDVELEFTNKPLHAKIYASENGLFITSANLLKNSLMRNIETGLMIRNQPPHEIEVLLSELRMH